jgi:hypothetical protein
MDSLKKIANLAAKFEKTLLKNAVETSQANVKDVLQSIVSPAAVGPLLDAAKVPSDVKVDVIAVVDPNSNVTFAPVGSPNDESIQTLTRLLNAKFSGSLTNAVKKMNIPPHSNTMSFSLVTF